MTAKIPDEYYRSLHSRPHPAILLTVDASLDMKDGVAVSRGIGEYLEQTPDTGNELPVWVRFVDLDTVNVYSLQSYFCPTDKLFLAKLVTEIGAVKKHISVPSFDFRARQYPKKTQRATPASPRLKRETHSDNMMHLDPNRLPLNLRFFVCPQAQIEAKQLGTIYSRWPFYGFNGGDLLEFANKLVAEFEERYPNLAKADKAIGGRLTKVISELGKQPHQPAFELRQFWTAVKHGYVSVWSDLADNLLGQIACGKVDAYRWHEEVVETAAETHLYGDLTSRGTRPVAANLIPIHRPPSVSCELWNAVPSDMQREAVEFAARRLRCGIHPEDAIVDFVSKFSISQN
ncbi:hypothetical protein GAO09_08560 [Rhizobiales bacterium RZME27]|uniref:Uncharacterized protein n=1 Tax=Endobacterium cereale TaxID=2663029 RepID=A0A6A8AA25_9HYPH|nr:hypothetical protein [Endobacterium cereale]MQY46106.1 hypothetical protein [Endobacterium cereale]